MQELVTAPPILIADTGLALMGDARQALKKRAGKSKQELMKQMGSFWQNGNAPAQMTKEFTEVVDPLMKTIRENALQLAGDLEERVEQKLEHLEHKVAATVKDQLRHLETFATELIPNINGFTFGMAGKEFVLDERSQNALVGAIKAVIKGVTLGIISDSSFDPPTLVRPLLWDSRYPTTLNHEYFATHPGREYLVDHVFAGLDERALGVNGKENFPELSAANDKLWVCALIILNPGVFEELPKESDIPKDESSMGMSIGEQLHSKSFFYIGPDKKRAEDPVATRFQVHEGPNQ